MDVFEKALVFALKAHEGQIRKRENIPFILHPCEAATIASTLTNDREILAAVLLHDTVEDTDTTIGDVREALGDRVAELVAGETENQYEELSREASWKRRKEESLAHLKDTDDVGVKIMWLSDKLSNMRSFHRQFLTEGDAMWEHYHQKDKAQQAWYYHTIADLLSEFADTAAYQEYTTLMNIIFGGQT
jgi:myo-inositol-1(or 4)-monophosphatase